MPRSEPSNDERLARHCTAKNFRDTDRTVLTGETFKPFESDEYLSINWLEYHAGTDDERLLAVCKDLSTMRRLKPNDRLAIIHVRRVKEIGAEFKDQLRVTHEPINKNVSHAGIWGIPLNARLLHQELAAEASQDIRPVRLSDKP